MRVLVGSLMQESNTFSPVRADLSFFESGTLLAGEASLDGTAGRRTELGAFVEVLRGTDAELVPTVAAWASSAGPLRGEDFRRLADMLLQRAEGAGPVDAALLSLHGAWAAEGRPDADGYLLSEVRRLLGPDTPLVATLDLHANVTEAMSDAADVLVGYETYPHVDMYGTGERAARLLLGLLRDDAKPVTTVRKVPMIFPPENAGTFEGPLRAVVDEVELLRQRPGVLSASLFTVQPWLDVPEVGCAVVVVTDGERGWARGEADRIGELLWERRREFEAPLLSPEEAVERALAFPVGPVLLVDSADSVSSGSPGDGTAVLRVLLAAKPARPALVTLVDPEAARAAHDADGGLVRLEAGGRLDPGRSSPVELVGRSRRVKTRRVVFESGVGDGLTADLGRAAVVEVGEVRVLLLENSVVGWDPALYRVAGLEPEEAQAVVVKTPNNFRRTYRGVAEDWVYVDAPGASTPKLKSLTFKEAPRPLYPFEDWDWSPVGHREAAESEIPYGRDA